MTPSRYVLVDDKAVKAIEAAIGAGLKIEYPTRVRKCNTCMAQGITFVWFRPVFVEDKDEVQYSQIGMALCEVCWDATKVMEVLKK